MRLKIEDKKEVLFNELIKFKEKQVVIDQIEFIDAKFTINLEYKVEYDTLMIKEYNEEKFIFINLNQMYKYEINDNEIKIYLDNDTIIEFLIKNRC